MAQVIQFEPHAGPSFIRPRRGGVRPTDDRLVEALRQVFAQRPYALQTQRQFLGDLLTDAGFDDVLAELDGLDVGSLAALLEAVLRRPAAPMAELLRNDPDSLRVLQVFMRGQRGDD
jgi:hypothetical protein